MTLEQLVQHFTKYPSYLDTGSPKLSKQFGVTTETILESKQMVRNILKEEIMRQSKTNTMSLEEFGKMIGIDTNDTSNNLKINEESEDVGEEWETRQKWIKTREGSTLLVRKKTNDEVDYKKEFQHFLDNHSPKSQVTVKPNFSEYSSALMVYMSDKHIGASTKDGALFKNEWNKAEFEKRMSTLSKEIIRLNELYHFDSILLFDLGDAVDGMYSKTTRGDHILPQNMSNREVYSTFIEVHLNFIYTLVQNITSNIHFITCGDSNHGGDFEWICNKSLEHLISLKFPEVQTFIGNKFIEHFEVNDHCFIVCHGKDSEDMKFPFPAVLNEKTELYFKQYIDHHQIKSKFIHIIKGDLHLSSCQYGQFFRYKNVLSMYGSSKWIQTNYMVNTKGVSMDILHNNNIMEYQLFL